MKANTLGQRLRTARERNGWSQAQVAAWTGIDPSQLSHYEADRREPTVQNVRRLCEGLRVKSDWLLDVATL